MSCMITAIMMSQCPWSRRERSALYEWRIRMASGKGIIDGTQRVHVRQCPGGVGWVTRRRGTKINLGQTAERAEPRY